MQTVDFKKMGLVKGDRILDLGCGEGRHTITAYIHDEVQAVGVDLSLNDITTAQERTQQFKVEDTARSIGYAQTNGLRLPFADNSFDKVVCSEVLEHIPNYYGVLQEIKRVLKPEGVLAVSVPRAWPERICWWLSEPYHRVDGGHIRIFHKYSLQKEIEALGMQHFDGHGAHALHVPYWWLRCLFDKNPDANPLVKWYHKLLVWDLMKRPKLTQMLDRILNPVMGKSVVMYFTHRGDR